MYKAHKNLLKIVAPNMVSELAKPQPKKSKLFEVMQLNLKKLL